MSVPNRITFERRALHRSALWQIDDVSARPAGAGCGEYDAMEHNVVVLPYRGVFTTHFDSRHSIVGTPAGAVFLGAHVPHCYGFPGAIGDHALVFRLPAGSLARVMPEAMDRDSLATRRTGLDALLPARAVLARARLRQLLHRVDADPLHVDELALAVLTSTWSERCMASQDRAVRRRAAPSLRRRIGRVQALIASDPARPWTLAELSRAADASAYHFARHFRREMGTSAYDYVLRLRLARALDLLLDSDLDLTTLALDAGFSSHSHFTARFRGAFGTTPSLARRLASGRTRELRRIATVPLTATA